MVADCEGGKSRVALLGRYSVAACEGGRAEVFVLGGPKEALLVNILTPERTMRSYAILASLAELKVSCMRRI